MNRIDDFNWFKPDAGDDAREEEHRADPGRWDAARKWDADGARQKQDGRWEFRDDITADGIKGGQGRSAESVRSDAIGLFVMVGLALSAALVIWLFT